MSDILCVTNRLLCRGDFLSRVEELAAAGPRGILLREKDLDESGYLALAERVKAICDGHGVPCILHGHPAAAEALGCPALHLPLADLRALDEKTRARFTVLGASCHSAGDALSAERLGCTYVTAGHVFDTDCKRGLPGRGLDFLREVCESVAIPVYAIGGIGPKNADPVRSCGAAGLAVMSGPMTCTDVKAYLKELDRGC
ncbi:MAG: thiamine phosphate synthase [Oscillospiraceae bacterium]|nr:thiamine phosphate synthase [Oscillospiraceae bacterium]